jgi:Tol biopolymer transport system component
MKKRMKKRWMRQSWIGFLLAGGAVAFAPTPVTAQPFNLTQITNTPTGTGNSFPAISGNGTRIAFFSTANLTPSPGNADGNAELFLFDTTSGLFTQITNTTGGSIGNSGNSFPAINATGTRIAFASDRNLVPGSPGNADGNDEIFLFDTTTGLFTQITNTVGSGASAPTINAAGTRIAYILGGQVVLFDTTTGVPTPITTGGGCRAPSIDAAGTRIAFICTADLTPGSPGNADNSPEIFLFDTTTSVLRQITNTSAGPVESFTQPAISGNGARIAFVFDRDLAPGSPGNADGSSELFLFDIASGVFTQITNNPAGFLSPTFRVSINGTGTRIVFHWPGNLTPGNPGNADGNSEIFLFDTTTGLFTQITNSTGGGNVLPSISADGTRIAFFSDRNLTPNVPGNADGNSEIFLAAPPGAVAAAAIPTLSEWMQALAAALLLATGLFALRRGARQPSRTT